MLKHIAVFSSFLRLDNIPLYVQLTLDKEGVRSADPPQSKKSACLLTFPKLKD